MQAIDKDRAHILYHSKKLRAAPCLEVFKYQEEGKTVDNQKVTTRHLQRRAYLYVRQSTLRQVIENTESAHRQYALRERAVALGWPPERVVVIDEDLGQSGASAAGREGFQRLVADVSLGLVGIILGLEVSRLARCSSDWYRLLEICALTDTLILDEEGLYDPNSFNDRLLLGLKGTMSEAELHFLKMRMRGGVLSKARRGELKGPLPVGLVYGPDHQVHLDPDQQVQDVFCNVSPHRRGHRHSQGLWRPRAPLSAPPDHGTTQRRTCLEPVDPLPGTSDTEKSPLCRSFLLRPATTPKGDPAPGRMDFPSPGGPCGLHFLGRIRRESAPAKRQRQGRQSRTPQPAPGRSRPVTRACYLRSLRPADVGAIPYLP